MKNDLFLILTNSTFGCPRLMEILITNRNVLRAVSFCSMRRKMGQYLACFEAPDHKEVTVSVGFEWNRGQGLEGGQERVHRCHGAGAGEAVLMTKMFHLRGREEEMQELNKSTNSQMAVFSFISHVACMSVAGFQFWHLKTFFEKNKII